MCWWFVLRIVTWSYNCLSKKEKKKGKGKGKKDKKKKRKEDRENKRKQKEKREKNKAIKDKRKRKEERKEKRKKKKNSTEKQESYFTCLIKCLIKNTNRHIYERIWFILFLFILFFAGCVPRMMYGLQVRLANLHKWVRVLLGAPFTQPSATYKQKAE